MPAIVSAQAPPGDASFRNGDFAQAGSAYAAAVARNAKDEAALIGLARVELYRNDLDAASATARRVLAIDAGNADAARILRTIDLRRRLFEQGERISIPDRGAVLPFVESEPLPMIELTIDGRPANCILDTGAPDVVIDPDFAAQAGIAVTGGQVGTFAGGRTATVRQAMLQRLQAGPIELRNITAGVLPSRGISFYRDRRVDCTVGTGFLMRFLSTIDYPRKRLILRRRTEEAANAGAGVSMPMWLAGDHFIFA
ncbi:MAG TPA: aspartyl protease family protein, partial [Candidatus Baltobacteraceae bacterium]|nr:aspartyl protease family protein [Candidatus Baltobacteraceae bacterium]